jgi:hypothetical protein
LLDPVEIAMLDTHAADRIATMRERYATYIASHQPPAE